MDKVIPESSNDILAKSTFLVGFLAALIGMAAFKEELSSVYLTFFHWDISLLYVSAPMILAMLVAAYLGALSHFLSNVSIFRLPLSKYLTIASNGSAILSLVYPLVIVLLLLLSWTTLTLDIDRSMMQTIFVGLAGVIAIIAIIGSLAASSRLLSIDTVEELQKLINKVDILTSNSKPSPSTFLGQYEQLLYVLKTFVKIKGYGTNRKNIASLVTLLHKAGTYTTENIEQAKSIDRLRNSYIEGKYSLTHKDVSEAIKVVEQLYMRLEQSLKQK